MLVRQRRHDIRGKRCPLLSNCMQASASKLLTCARTLQSALPPSHSRWLLGVSFLSFITTLQVCRGLVATSWPAARLPGQEVATGHFHALLGLFTCITRSLYAEQSTHRGTIGPERIMAFFILDESSASVQNTICTSFEQLNTHHTD